MIVFHWELNREIVDLWLQLLQVYDVPGWVVGLPDGHRPLKGAGRFHRGVLVNRRRVFLTSKPEGAMPLGEFVPEKERDIYLFGPDHINMTAPPCDLQVHISTPTQTDLYAVQAGAILMNHVYG